MYLCLLRYVIEPSRSKIFELLLRQPQGFVKKGVFEFSHFPEEVVLRCINKGLDQQLIALLEFV